MPFVVRFHTGNLEYDPHARFDPISGVVLPVVSDRGMTALEKLAVAEQLRLAGGVGPDAFEKYRVYFPGGTPAEALFPGLTRDGKCTYGTLIAPAPTHQLMRLAFELSRGGGLVFIPDGVARPLVVSEAMRGKVLRRWLNVQVCPTAGRAWQLVAPPPPPDLDTETRRHGDTETESADPPAEPPAAV